MNRLVTGEAVTIDLRVARLGSRIIAGLIDLVLQAVVLVVIAWAAFTTVAPGDEALASALYLAVVVLVVVGYPTTTETLWRGRSIGKAAMGLRVVRDDGGPIRFRHAFVRALLGAVVERPGALLAIPGMISMLVSGRSKRLGDLLAGTVVLQERIPPGAAVPVMMPPQLAGWAAALDLSSFEDTLALAVRQFLGRARELSPQACERIGSHLAASVYAVVTPPPPPGTHPWAYLSAVLAERTARARWQAERTAGAQWPLAGAGTSPAQPAPPWGAGQPWTSGQPWPAHQGWGIQPGPDGQPWTAQPGAAQPRAGQPGAAQPRGRESWVARPSDPDDVAEAPTPSPFVPPS
ncbi:MULTISPECIES: RDD family protein [Protofrankia]|uniref:RDD domain containing protein n=1 Tax=Candidatus Protofrankia datiscae TaxID=2716812 RepID=F8B2J5_9ACTN|nr:MULTISPECIES: RDD family protein [Protofrankia]AEH08597.1 RDD domain containing protein [Candidatus Protofrankia datiscae]